MHKSQLQARQPAIETPWGCFARQTSQLNLLWGVEKDSSACPAGQLAAARLRRDCVSARRARALGRLALAGDRPPEISAGCDCADRAGKWRSRLPSGGAAFSSSRDCAGREPSERRPPGGRAGVGAASVGSSGRFEPADGSQQRTAASGTEVLGSARESSGRTRTRSRRGSDKPVTHTHAGSASRVVLAK
jgi:hypothetical protein